MDWNKGQFHLQSYIEVILLVIIKARFLSFFFQANFKYSQVQNFTLAVLLSRQDSIMSIKRITEVN